MSILETITDIYENIMPKQSVMLPHKEALDYFARLLMNGNIIIVEEDGELKGFLEFWKITPEILGKVIVGLPISHDTDLLNGSICLISRMWIEPSERQGHTFLHLASQLLRLNKDSTHYVALQQHKHHKPIQIYTRDEVLKHYKI